MDVQDYIGTTARESMAVAIDEAGGNEVFFIGRLGDGGLVDEVEVHCRGSAEAVPALLGVPRAGEVVLHNHPSGELQPSHADLSLASRFGQDGIAFFIVDNAVEAVYVVVEPQRGRHTILDADRIAARFDEGGELSEHLDGYECRPSQAQMARHCTEVINDAGIALVEAGTGTGKSLAYLVPLAEHALTNRVRVAVSTASINLQGQLLHKDIPLVRDLVGPLTAAMVKGRGNYLCRRKLETLVGERQIYTASEQTFLERMAAWVESTRDGSRSDLPNVPLADLWEMVRSDADQCLRSRCAHFQDCFYYQSRRAAASADVLIVNHHLLVADLNLKHASGDSGALPGYEALVLDEGHHLEEVASDQLATTVTSVGIERLLGRIVPRSGRRSGLLKRLDRCLPDEGGPIRQMLERRLAPAVNRAREELPTAVEAICTLVHGSGEGTEERAYRFPALLASMPPPVRPLVDHVEQLVSLLGRVSSALGRVRKAVERLPPSWMEREIQLYFDLRSCHDRITRSIRALGAAIEENEDTCRWIEVDRTRRGALRPRFCSCPVDVAPLIRDRILDAVPAVVITSATLTVDQRFDFLMQRIGIVAGTLAHERTVSANLPSPFDFSEQVLVGVPRGFPDPRSPGFVQAAESFICELVEAARGRTFVLFTSYRLLQRVQGTAEQRLKGYRVLAQGTMERGRLLDEFRSGGKAVLLGTDSFWEGVDVPGEALSSVLLTRLPFRVPTHPVQRARAELIEARGGDPFAELSLPQAVIRFRQGFGRLIRSRTDRGVVVILDPRVNSQRYGRVFLNSLPPAHVVTEPRDAILAAVKAFLAAPEQKNGA
jgi:ATP-dependent DNA helicase DinG